jgi:hypothetical protein
MRKTWGGVILYVKDNINVSRRDDLDFDDLEGIWVQIKINGKQILRIRSDKTIEVKSTHFLS